MNRRLLAILAVAVIAVGIAGALLYEPGPTYVALPGTDPVTLAPTLRQDLEAIGEKRRSRGEAPRTRHLHADGTPRYTNRLVSSASTYLRQHAHNPVNWFPWGDEAFELAAKLNRPVFLSVGYATCHWCHVMEEESFEDPEIAAYLNANYIAIKVDRDQRPDVDRIYMSAVQAIHRRGGWPMSVWLKPDRQPFFAATYLPARDGDRGSRKGFLTFLTEIATTWKEHPDEIEGTAENLTQAVRNNLAPAPDSGVPGPEVFDMTLEWAEERFDPVHGGVQGQPKFPSGLPLRVMLSAGAKGDLEVFARVETTLNAMAAGGLYDHVGGGFHRYTVDDAWQIPHFEKMLYDNAQLVRVYAEAFQLTHNLDWAAVVDETVTFMLRDLRTRSGGFASALDADSLTPAGEREEGWYYTWTPAEIDAVLGEDSVAFQAAYGVTPTGNFEGRNILHLDPEDWGNVRERWGKARLKLQLERRKRRPPLLDTQVLTGWNGLAIDALAFAGGLRNREDWIDEARFTAELLLAARSDGRLARIVIGDEPRGVAFLEDYAFLIRGLITLFETTGEVRWLDAAVELEAVAREHHGDEGAWFRAPDDHETLLVRDKPAFDQSVPSANTVMVDNLLRLAALTGEDPYRARAEQIAGGLDIARAPAAFPVAVLALDGRHTPLEEVVLVEPEGTRAVDLRAALKRAHPSWRVLIPTTGDDPALGERVPPAAGKTALDGQPTAYVCRGGVCDRPTTDPDVFVGLLTRRAQPPAAP